MKDREMLIATSSWQAGYISDREYMGRYVAKTFGVTGRLITGIRSHRSGHRHRGTLAWSRRYARRGR